MSRRAKWIILGVVLVVIVAFGYLRLNQLSMGVRSVDLPPEAEVVYEYGDRFRWSFAGHYSIYFRYAFAPGTPEEVCDDLEASIGSEFQAFDTSTTDPRPCEWRTHRWGARVDMKVLDVTELAPNNHPISAPEGWSIISVSAD